eukprot:350895-Chlamydomonas_euryale.AAC.10
MERTASTSGHALPPHPQPCPSVPDRSRLHLPSLALTCLVSPSPPKARPYLAQSRLHLLRLALTCPFSPSPPRPRPYLPSLAFTSQGSPVCPA